MDACPVPGGDQLQLAPGLAAGGEKIAGCAGVPSQGGTVSSFDVVQFESCRPWKRQAVVASQGGLQAGTSGEASQAVLEQQSHKVRATRTEMPSPWCPSRRTTRRGGRGGMSLCGGASNNKLARS